MAPNSRIITVVCVEPRSIRVGGCDPAIGSSATASSKPVDKTAIRAASASTSCSGYTSASHHHRSG